MKVMVEFLDSSNKVRIFFLIAIFSSEISRSTTKMALMSTCSKEAGMDAREVPSRLEGTGI